MAVSSRLKFGKIETTKRYGGGIYTGGFIRCTATVTAGSNVITNIQTSTGYFGLEYAQIGYVFGINFNTGPAGGFQVVEFYSFITSIDINNNTITISDPAPANTAASNRTVYMYPSKGNYFFVSGSLTTPNFSNWSAEDVTGSNDDFYIEGTNKWGILGQLSFISTPSNPIGGYFGQYELYKTYERGTFFGVPWIHFYITSKDGTLFEDEDKTLTTNTNENVFGLVELSPTESLATIFNPGEVLSNDLSLGLAAYQASLSTYDLKLDGLLDGFSAFPYTGSAQITGSLGVTGSVEFNTQVGGTDFFILRSGSVENFKINGEGIAQFYAYPNDYTPTPVLGGLFFQTSSAWIGLE